MEEENNEQFFGEDNDDIKQNTNEKKNYEVFKIYFDYNDILTFKNLYDIYFIIK